MSSYRGHFHDLSPSDQADIASFSEVVPLADESCDLCGEPIDQDDISVEAFEMTGALACTACLESMAEEGHHDE